MASYSVLLYPTTLRFRTAFSDSIIVAKSKKVQPISFCLRFPKTLCSPLIYYNSNCHKTESWYTMKTIIKWPGGKSREVEKIKHLIPEYDRYIEPFFRRRCRLFYLQPKHAIINDISPMLIRFYQLVKAQGCFVSSLSARLPREFQSLLAAATLHEAKILDAYLSHSDSAIKAVVTEVLNQSLLSEDLILDRTEFYKTVTFCVKDKFTRTEKNNKKVSLY